jgi:predicted neutral ceramidase superfamily lipid hydrolase
MDMQNNDEKRIESERKQKAIDDLSNKISELLIKPVPKTVIDCSYQKALQYKAALKKAWSEVSKVRKNHQLMEQAYSELKVFYK